MVNTDKVSFFYQDTVQQGLSILAPDINSSELAFTVPSSSGQAGAAGVELGSEIVSVDGSLEILVDPDRLDQVLRQAV